jgi:hypothetical protein
MGIRGGLALVIGLCLLPSQASADITAFLGATPTPANRGVKGVAVGAGLLIVAFEFEYANVTEDPIASAPALRTGMGNVLIQTPLTIAGFQPYLTTGGGLYRERLGERQETSVGLNAGGGVKMSIAGPLRLRLDYREFTLRGDPMHSRVRRFYAGANVKF